jgi:hypothetical protein
MGEDQRLQEYLVEEQEAEPAPVSRRRFLAGAVVGGAAGLAVAAGTGVSVWKTSEAETQLALDEANAEIARLQGLVDLYEDLDKIPLEAILKAGMAAVMLPIEGVELGATSLKNGLDAFEEALLSLDEALPSAREAMVWLENRVSALANGVEKLEASLGRALGKAGNSPVGATLKDFASMVLDNLPFGLGDRLREVLDDLVGLATSVDELVEDVNTKLLEPLRETWFADEDGKGVAAMIIDPVVEHVLDPLEAHLEELAMLADTWQAKLVEPVEKAMAERADLRAEISQFKNDHGLA